MATKTKKPAATRRPDGPIAVDCLLSREDVQAALRLSKRTLSTYLSSGEFPPPDTYLGKLPRWRVSTVNAWIAARCAGKGA